LSVSDLESLSAEQRNIFVFPECEELLIDDATSPGLGG
jgi:hypothetical protein